MSANDNDSSNKIEPSHEAVTLAEEISHLDSLAVPSGETDLWEETAAGVLTKAGDCDLLFWAADYALFGNGQGD